MYTKIIALLFSLSILFTACTLNFVKDDELKALQQKYEGIYICIADIVPGNNDTIKAGTSVRLYLQSGSNSIKVYAYPIDEPREKALGKNILYLFDTDFPESKFMDVVLEKKINQIVKKQGSK